MVIRWRPPALDHSELDWSIGTAIQRERWLLAVLAAGFVLGLVLLSVGWVLAGIILVLGTGLGMVSRVLVGMLKS
jgi:hypothetical protein